MAFSLALAGRLHAATANYVLNGATELSGDNAYSGGTPTSASDVTFDGATTYSPTAFTLNGGNITVDSLNDLDATQALSVSGADVITLANSTTSNSVAPLTTGSSQDGIFVAQGASLSLFSGQTVGGVMAPSAGTTIDNQGTLVIGGTTELNNTSSSNASVLTIDNGYGGTININLLYFTASAKNAGATINNYGGTITIGGIRGTGYGDALTLNGSGNISIGGGLSQSGDSFTQSGCTIIQNDTGTVSLTAPSSVSSGYTLNAGTLVNTAATLSTLTITAGTATLSGGNVGSGATESGAGSVLNLNAASLVSNKLVVNGGELNIDANNAFATSLTINGAIVLDNTSGSLVSVSPLETYINSSFTFGGTSALQIHDAAYLYGASGTTETITANGTAPLGFYNVLSLSSTGVNTVTQLVKAGSGELDLGMTISAGTDVISGGVVVQSGTLGFGANGALGAGATVLGSAGASNAALIVKTSGVTAANAISTVAADTGALALGNSATSGNAAFSGLVTLNTPLTVTQAAGGTLTFSGTITGASATSSPETLTLAAASTGAINISNGGITNGSGPGSALSVMVTGGSDSFGAANAYTGSTVIAAGELTGAGANSLSTTSSVQVYSGATLALTASNVFGTPVAGAGTPLGTFTPVTLGNGGLGTAFLLRGGSGVSEGTGSSVGMGVLTLAAGATLDFGTTGVGTLNLDGFSDSGNFTLTIADYSRTTATGLAGIDGTDDRLIFNGQLTVGQLADIVFTGAPDSGAAQEVGLGNGEYEVEPMSAVPEPSFGFQMLGFLGIAAVMRRKLRAGKVRVG
ncbi:MAG TPA: hypothetical protein VHY22_18865 [Chthoniobacteraceae bacterium]|nr:hypothetical protein [Chthoniobacteraceae bacterium]